MTAGIDFQLVGFDGQEIDREDGSGESALTTVAAPIERMARSTAQVVIQRLTEPNLPLMRVYLGCELYAGATAVARNP